MAEQSSKRHAHFSLQATVGINARNRSAVFSLLSLYAVSLLGSHPQIRCLALFTDCRCCSSEILHKYVWVHHIVWPLVPKSQKVSDPLSPGHSALQGMWMETEVVNRYALRWSKHSLQLRFFNFSKHLRTNFQWSVLLVTCKKTLNTPLCFMFSENYGYKTISDNISAYNLSQVHRISKNRENKIRHPWKHSQ